MHFEPDDHQHIRDLLPAFANHTLEAEDVERVQEHIECCPRCEQDLRAWQHIALAVKQQMLSSLPATLPSATFLDSFPQQVQHTKVSAATPNWLQKKVLPLLRLFLYQYRFLPAISWFLLPFTITVGFLVAIRMGCDNNLPKVLSFIVPITTALSVTLLQRPDGDTAQEIICATPTSFRFICFCRFTLIFSYSFCLALIATVFLTMICRVNIPQVVSCWIGPMLFLTGLSLFVSHLLGVRTGIMCVMSLWYCSFFSSSFNWISIGHHFIATIEHYIRNTDLTTFSAALGFVGFSLIFMSYCIYNKNAL